MKNKNTVITCMVLSRMLGFSVGDIWVDYHLKKKD